MGLFDAIEVIIEVVEAADDVHDCEGGRDPEGATIETSRNSMALVVVT